MDHLTHGIGATMHISQEIQCFPYLGSFLVNICVDKLLFSVRILVLRDLYNSLSGTMTCPLVSRNTDQHKCVHFVECSKTNWYIIMVIFLWPIKTFTAINKTMNSFLCFNKSFLHVQNNALIVTI